MYMYMYMYMHTTYSPSKEYIVEDAGENEGQ